MAASAQTVDNRNFGIDGFAEAVESQRQMGDTAVFDEKGNKLTHVDTGIQEVGTTTSSAKNGKYLKNGKLVIEKDGKQFNAAGVATD